MALFKPIDLEGEKHQRRGEIGDFFLRIRHKFGAVAIGGHLIIAQPREGHDAPRDGADFLVSVDTVEQLIGG